LSESGRSCDSVDFSFEDDVGWGVGAVHERKLEKWISSFQSGVAIMAAHDFLANRIVDLASHAGLRVPNDIAVLGVGNHDMLCRLSPVQISSIDASVPEVAVRGGEMLEKMILGESDPRSVLVLPTPVVERDSTKILAYADDLVVKVVEYIRTHFAESISAGRLSERFNVSHRVLSRRFAKYVGHSPAAEIREVRLRGARRLIETTNLPLSEIAYSCGYADLSHMYRVFRDKLNLTPKDLR
jgi:LacI family transcriptional regulator